MAQCGHVWHLVTMMLGLLQLITLTLATLGGVVLGEPECDR